MSEVQQITKANFIRLGVAAFKEHELREIVATFCKLPGIAPLAASQGSAGGERGGVRSEDTAKVAADLQELMDVIEAVRGERGLLRVSGTRGDPNDVGVLGIERFNDLMIRAIDALAIPTLAQGARGSGAWCQPMDCGKHTPRKFMIYFEDPDHGIMVFDNEAEARDAFARKNTAWNCYLMASLPLEASALPSTNDQGAAK